MSTLISQIRKVYPQIIQDLIEYEWAVMRCNCIPEICREVEYGNVKFYVNVSNVSIKNPRRGLDISLVTYVILKRLTQTIKESLQNKDLNSLLKEIIVDLVNLGLLYLCKPPIHDNIQPIKFIRVTNREMSLDLSQEVSSDGDFSSLKAASAIIKFMRSRNLRINLDKLENDVRTALGIDKSNVLSGYSHILFKTCHGELVRLLDKVGALPDTLAAYEVLILPYMKEEKPKPYSELCNELTKIVVAYLKDTVKDQSIAEKLGRIIVDSVIEAELEKSRKRGLYRYQFEYLKRLLQSNSPNLAMLDAPTGSGKTLVFILYVLAKILKAKLNHNKNRVAVLIYPRKSLSRDQLRRMLTALKLINDRLEEEKLSKYKIKVAIRDYASATIKGFKDLLENSGKNLTSLREIEVTLKENGREKKYKLHHGIDGKNEYKVWLICKKHKTERIEIDWVMDLKDDDHIKSFDPDILITNVYMLMKTMLKDLPQQGTDFIQVLQGSSSTGLPDVLKKVSTIVLDEAHIYATTADILYVSSAMKFLLTILLISDDSMFNDICALCNNGDFDNEKLSRIIEKVCKKRSLDLILSSATLSGKEFFGEISSHNIVGFKVERSHRENNIRSDDIANEEIIDYVRNIIGTCWFNAYGNRIIHLRYTEFLEGNHDAYRLVLPIVMFPTPNRNPYTTLTESLVTLVLWAYALRHRTVLSKNGKKEPLFNPSFIIFIDSKDTIDDIFYNFHRRQIWEVIEPADRTLMSIDFQYEGDVEDQKERLGYRIIGNLVHSLLEKNWNLLDISMHDQLYDYSHLHLFVTPNILCKISSSNLDKKHKISECLQVCKDKRLYDAIKEIHSSSHNYIIKCCGEFDEYVKKLSQRGVYPTLLKHYADIKSRSSIEHMIKSARVIGVLATSTLEVGVDVPDISIIGQYGTTARDESLHQRIGRGGRSLKSFNTVLSILFLKNTGEDISLLDEENAISYIYNIRQKPLLNPERNPEVFGYLIALAIGWKLNSACEEHRALATLCETLFTAENKGETERILRISSEITEKINDLENFIQGLNTSSGQVFTDYRSELQNKYEEKIDMIRGYFSRVMDEGDDSISAITRRFHRILFNVRDILPSPYIINDWDPNLEAMGILERRTDERPRDEIRREAYINFRNYLRSILEAVEGIQESFQMLRRKFESTLENLDRTISYMLDQSIVDAPTIYDLSNVFHYLQEDKLGEISAKLNELMNVVQLLRSNEFAVIHKVEPRIRGSLDDIVELGKELRGRIAELRELFERVKREIAVDVLIRDILILVVEMCKSVILSLYQVSEEFSSVGVRKLKEYVESIVHYSLYPRVPHHIYGILENGLLLKIQTDRISLDVQPIIDAYRHSIPLKRIGG